METTVTPSGNALIDGNILDLESRDLKGHYGIGGKKSGGGARKMDAQYYYELTTLLLCLHHVIAQMTPCICTMHVRSDIYNRPSESSTVVGFFYNGECKARRTEEQLQHRGFVPVEYYHQIAYVKLDGPIVLKLCDNSELDIGDKFTGSLPTTTSSTQSSTSTILSGSNNPTSTLRTTTPIKMISTVSSNPNIASHPNTASLPHSTSLPRSSIPTARTASVSTTHKARNLSATTSTSTSHDTTLTITNNPVICNKMQMFVNIAKDINVGLFSSTTCANKINHPPEAALTVYCGAPDRSQWKPGPRVMSHCSQHDKYIPIAIFDQNGAAMMFSGIFLECTNTYLYFVSQTCDSGAQIMKVTDSDDLGAWDFKVVNW